MKLMRVKSVNEDKYETLSALVDGEYEDATGLLKRVGTDAALSARWGEYHRTRAIMQRSYTGTLDDGFSGRVSAALDKEPTILAPQVANTVGKRRRSERETRWQRPALGFAIAATVAAVSVFGLNRLPTTSSPSIPAVASNTNAGAQTPTTQIVLPGIDVRRVSLDSSGTHWHVQRVDQQRDAALEERLNRYLADHMEYANSSKVQGMLPYSRLVGYDATE